MTNPYSNVNPYQYWPTAIEGLPIGLINFIPSPKFFISKSDAVSTIGSCFAQHISRELESLDFNVQYFETASKKEDSLNQESYKIFSARYGNVYTVRQALELFMRATSKTESINYTWKSKKGRYLDPYRPNAIPNGFPSEEDLFLDRKIHMNAVMNMIINSNVIIFTLGLTEAWKEKTLGHTLPLAPGVVGGDYDEGSYEFENFSYESIKNDLEKIVDLLISYNPSLKFIFTVSPVSLKATYENKNVLLATELSKSRLRLAIDSVISQRSYCEYFPSYEIITTPWAGNAFYMNDRREVNQNGVATVMSLFRRSMISTMNKDYVSLNRKKSTSANLIVCDESLVTIEKDITDFVNPKSMKIRIIESTRRRLSKIHFFQDQK
jgi:hypothetical protein